MEEKDIQDIFAEVASSLVIDIRNELTESESEIALYSKLVWAYYLGKNEEIPSIRKEIK